MQVALHIQKTSRRLRCVLNILSIRLTTNSPSTTEPPGSICVPIDGSHGRIVTIFPDKLSELVIAFGTRNMEPIVVSIDCLGKVKDLTIRSDATVIDYVLNFDRLGAPVDANAADNLDGRRFGILFGDRFEGLQLSVVNSILSTDTLSMPSVSSGISTT
jgi:hypothetical protein